MSNGEAPVWAAAVRQLILTADKGEQLHFIVRQRGAWLTAYASHVLSMAVKIIVQQEIMWECAGPRGAAVFEFSSENNSIRSNTRKTIFTIIESPSTEDGRLRMAISYDLCKALSTEFPLCFETEGQNSISEREVQVLIMRFCYRSLTRIRILSRDGHPLAISGEFERSSAALEKVLIDLGIPLDIIQSTLAKKYEQGPYVDTMGLSYPIFELIFGIVALALALMQCAYNADTVHVDAAMVSGKSSSICLTTIKGACLPSTLKVYPADGRPQVTEFLPDSQDLTFAREAALIIHLSKLLHGPQAIELSEIDRTNFHAQALAVSASNTTIFYPAITDEECFKS